MADWLSPVISGIFEFVAGLLTPARTGDPVLQDVPIWKRIAILCLGVILVALGSVLLVYSLFSVLAFIGNVLVGT